MLFILKEERLTIYLKTILNNLGIYTVNLLNRYASFF